MCVTIWDSGCKYAQGEASTIVGTIQSSRQSLRRDDAFNCARGTDARSHHFPHIIRTDTIRASLTADYQLLTSPPLLPQSFAHCADSRELRRRNDRYYMIICGWSEHRAIRRITEFAVAVAVIISGGCAGVLKVTVWSSSLWRRIVIVLLMGSLGFIQFNANTRYGSVV